VSGVVPATEGQSLRRRNKLPQVLPRQTPGIRRGACYTGRAYTNAPSYSESGARQSTRCARMVCKQ
jgi:hypothetical protein